MKPRSLRGEPPGFITRARVRLMCLESILGIVSSGNMPPPPTGNTVTSCGASKEFLEYESDICYPVRRSDTGVPLPRASRLSDTDGAYPGDTERTIERCACEFVNMFWVSDVHDFNIYVARYLAFIKIMHNESSSKFKCCSATGRDEGVRAT